VQLELPTQRETWQHPEERGSRRKMPIRVYEPHGPALAREESQPSQSTG
jgi:hypothetical protein